MRPDWNLWRGCKLKRRFESPLAAERKAAKHGQRVYACARCGGYHLTSKR